MPIRGSIVALVTPMHDDGAVDWNCLAELVEWHVAEGTDGIVAVGTTGESATLDVEEHLEVVRKVVEQARGRLPVIAGTGANATREAIELTQEAEAAGATASLQVAPYYNKPTPEGLYQHFKAIADNTKTAGTFTGYGGTDYGTSSNHQAGITLHVLLHF